MIRLCMHDSAICNPFILFHSHPLRVRIVFGMPPKPSAKTPSSVRTFTSRRKVQKKPESADAVLTPQRPAPDSGRSTQARVKAVIHGAASKRKADKKERQVIKKKTATAETQQDAGGSESGLLDLNGMPQPDFEAAAQEEPRISASAFTALQSELAELRATMAIVLEASSRESGTPMRRREDSSATTRGMSEQHGGMDGSEQHGEMDVSEQAFQQPEGSYDVKLPIPTPTAPQWARVSTLPPPPSGQEAESSYPTAAQYAAKLAPSPSAQGTYKGVPLPYCQHLAEPAHFNTLVDLNMFRNCNFIYGLTEISSKRLDKAEARIAGALRVKPELMPWNKRSSTMRMQALGNYATALGYKYPNQELNCRQHMVHVEELFRAGGEDSQLAGDYDEKIRAKFQGDGDYPWGQFRADVLSQLAVEQTTKLGAQMQRGAPYGKAPQDLGSGKSRDDPKKPSSKETGARTPPSRDGSFRKPPAQGIKLCKFFNGQGCDRSEEACGHPHVCFKCKEKDHGWRTCPKK